MVAPPHRSLALPQHPLVARLDDGGRELLANRSEKVRFRPGRRVLQAGAPAEAVAVLLEGTIRTTLELPHDGGLLVTLGSAPGFWGDVEILAGTTLVQTVTTLEYSE